MIFLRTSRIAISWDGCKYRRSNFGGLTYVPMYLADVMNNILMTQFSLVQSRMCTRSLKYRVLIALDLFGGGKVARNTVNIRVPVNGF